MGPSTKDDLPNVASRQRFAVFEPLDHLVHEFRCDAKFVVFEEGKFGTRVGSIDIATAYEIASRQMINERNWGLRTFRYNLETSSCRFFFSFEFDSL